MASILREVEKFDKKREQRLQYVEQLDHFFVANNIVEDKKKAVYLFEIGLKPHRRLNSLLLPEKPGEKTYQQLVELLKAVQSKLIRNHAKV